MVNTIDFKYEDNDIISDTIINFYEKEEDKSKLENIINLYISDKSFFQFIQKNFLIKKISTDYLMRLYNDYEEDNIIEEYNMIEKVNTTRWI